MVMTIFAGIADFERTLIISRTNDGRVAEKVVSKSLTRSAG
jgi:hypothetical protein